MRAIWRSRAAWRPLTRPHTTPRELPQFCKVRWLSASAAGGLLGATGLLMSDRPLLAKEVAVRQEVWAWGRAQSIPGGAERDELRPVRVKWFEGHKPGWKKLAFGPCFGAALDGNGHLFVWGTSEKETEDGQEEIFVGPTALEILGDARGQRVVDVQCSSNHIFVLTARGGAYVFENVADKLRDTKLAANAPLQLQGQRMPGIPQPNLLHRVVGGGGVMQMSIGLEHAAFLSHGGDLFCTGANQWGQCAEQLAKRDKKMGAYEEATRVETVTPVRATFPKNAGRITSVSVGGQHTVATDHLGQKFAFGDDRRIQLGLGDTRTSGSDERNAIGVITRDALGGIGSKTELKRSVTYKYYEMHMQAAPVEMVPPPVQNRPPYPPSCFVVCGQDFTVACHRDSPDWYSKEEETNVLFACGENGEGQGGRHRQQQQQSWQMVRLPKKTRTVAVACGQGHSIAQTSTGEIWAWGMNQQGELGYGNRASTCPPVKVALGSEEEANEHRKVVSIACGFRNSGCICELPADEK